MSFATTRRYTSQNGHTGRSSQEELVVDYTLELIVVPVSDVDRAKAFYLDQVVDGRIAEITPFGPMFFAQSGCRRSWTGRQVGRRVA